MAQIFISYSRKDELFAQRLAEALAEQKRECWLDRKDIEFTADWKQRVLRGIEDAHAFVCVVSPDYAASTVCREETEHAVAQNKRLIPLLRRPVDFSALHPAIAAINALPFKENEDFDAGLTKLVEALDTDFDWLDQHTRLLRRALEWDGKARDKSLILRGSDLRAAEQWLMQAGSARERNPTQLQTEYILSSRRASNRRLRVLLGVAVAVIAMTILLAAVATYQRGIARSERARAEQRTREVSQSLSRSDFFEATRRLSANEAGAALAHLARALRTDPENKDAQRRLISLLSQRDWQFPALEPLVLSDSVWSADFSPDGKRIVTTSGTGPEKAMVQLWDIETAAKVGEPFSCTPPVTATLNSNGTRIAVMWDLNAGDARASSRCQLLDGITGRPIGEPTEHAGTLRASAFASDGNRLLLGYDLGNSAGEVCLLDAIAGGPLQTLLSFKDAVPEAFDATGAMVVTLGLEAQAIEEKRRVAGVWNVQGSDEEKWRIARVWNLRTGKPITKAFKHDQDLTGAIFSPDGDHIATRSKEQAFFWDLGTDSLITSTQPLPEEKLLWRTGYSPDAKLFLVIGVDHPAREMDWVAELRDAKTGELIPGGEIRDHGLFEGATFSQDSRFLCLYSSERRARVWRTRSISEVEPEEATAPLEHADVVTAAKLSPDGKRIVTASFDKTLRLWHATPGLGRALPEQIPTAQSVSFAEASPHGSRIAMISAEPPGLQIFDGETLEPRSSFMPHAKLIRSAAFSGDDRFLATAGEDGAATVWDASNGGLVAQFKHTAGEPIDTVKLDATGARAAIATPSGAILWDLAAHRATPLVRTSKQFSPGIAFSPDGARLLTVHNSELNMWDARTGAQISGPLSHAAGDSNQITFSPDGTRFAICGSESVVDVREGVSGKPAYLLQHRGVAVDAIFSPDGKLIATCSFVMQTSGYAQVWDAATGTPITQPLIAPDEVHRIAFTADGELLAATERGKGVRIWSIATGRECFDLIPHGIAAYAPSFSRDGKRLLTVINGNAQFHDLWVPGGVAPAWLPDLAESVGGFSLNANGVIGSVNEPVRKLNEIRATIASAQNDDPLLRWARWFLADRTTRTISPFSQRTMTDEIAVKGR